MSTQDDFCARFRAVVQRVAGGNVSAFARDTGIPRRTAQKVFERSIVNPGVSFVAHIVDRYPDIDLHWLVTGRASNDRGTLERAAEQRARELLAHAARGASRGARRRP